MRSYRNAPEIEKETQTRCKREEVDHLLVTRAIFENWMRGGGVSTSMETNYCQQCLLLSKASVVRGWSWEKGVRLAKTRMQSLKNEWAPSYPHPYAWGTITFDEQANARIDNKKKPTIKKIARTGKDLQQELEQAKAWNGYKIRREVDRKRCYASLNLEWKRAMKKQVGNWKGLRLKERNRKTRHAMTQSTRRDASETTWKW